MSSLGNPRALLFDIGGVVVVSPFQAILDYERAHSIPVGYVNFAISRSGPHGAWSLIERGLIPLDDSFFAHWTADLQNEDSWLSFHRRKHSTGPIPPLPQINGKALFWEMMRMSRAPDPWMWPALQKLKSVAKQKGLVLGALSNTVNFPPGIKDERGIVFSSNMAVPEDSATGLNTSEDLGADTDGTVHLRKIFDTFVSSADVGLRKPDPAIYRMAVKYLSDVTVGRGQPPLQPEDVLFLDDIGANLKGAREAGMRTLKVELGKTDLAVQELEKATGIQLLEVGKARL